MGFLTIWGGVLLLTGVLRSLGRPAEPDHLERDPDHEQSASGSLLRLAGQHDVETSPSWAGSVCSRWIQPRSCSSSALPTGWNSVSPPPSGGAGNCGDALRLGEPAALQHVRIEPAACSRDAPRRSSTASASETPREPRACWRSSLRNEACDPISSFPSHRLVILGLLPHYPIRRAGSPSPQRTSTFRNCHGSDVSMSSGKKPGLSVSGVQSV